MDAMITAGGVPEPGEPLYAYSQGQSKALIDVAGKPMIQWILDALSGARSIKNVLIVGLDGSEGLTCKKRLHYLPNQGSMLGNILGAAHELAAMNPGQEHVLIVSSDIPAINSQMVDWVVDQIKPEDDIVFNVIERSVMETRFPGSNRTYTKLKGIEVCGGDMNAVSLRTILDERSIWQQISDARKNPLKQAALVGFDTLLALLFRRVDIEGAARLASKNLGVNGRGVLCPFAEVGMDVDKDHQLEVVARDLAARSI